MVGAQQAIKTNILEAQSVCQISGFEDIDISEQVKDIMNASPEKIKWNSIMSKLKGIKAKGSLIK